MINELLHNVFLVIPWRETESRKPFFNKVIDNYKNIFIEDNIILSDSGSDIFNLSASRNLGIDTAINRSAETIVVSDADIIIDTMAIVRSIKYSKIRQRIVMPFNKLIFNNIEGQYLHEVSVPQSKESINPCAGCLVIPRQVYLDLGGFDERFVGWGPEDIDFHIRYIKKYNEMFMTIHSNATIFETDRSEWKLTEQTIKNYEYLWAKYPETKEIYYWK